MFNKNKIHFYTARNQNGDFVRELNFYIQLNNYPSFKCDWKLGMISKTFGSLLCSAFGCSVSERLRRNKWDFLFEQKILHFVCIRFDVSECVNKKSTQCAYYGCFYGETLEFPKGKSWGISQGFGMRIKCTLHRKTYFIKAIKKFISKMCSKSCWDSLWMMMHFSCKF